jgi:hypothetical protein
MLPVSLDCPFLIAPKDEQHGPQQNMGVNSGAHEGIQQNMGVNSGAHEGTQQNTGVNSGAHEVFYFYLLTLTDPQ